MRFICPADLLSTFRPRAPKKKWPAFGQEGQQETKGCLSLRDFPEAATAVQAATAAVAETSA
ncbi:MAG: hypothetical protein CTY25_03360 [Methylobacterium sp.]|nr:MAG: hypothetical protein CTY25_03360 [Methylobacterium sp.]